MSEKATNEITVRDNKPTMIDFPAMLKMAETLVKSGFLPVAIKTSAQAVAIVMTGRELGIPPMQSLRQINVIQGKPTMAAELMLALAYQHIPGFKYEILETTATHCVCKFTRPGHTPLTHKFDIDDAKAMQLAGKDNWKKQPATMLRWRCISSGLRLIAPDAIAGVYSPEEILPDATIDEESGTIIDVDPEPPKVDAFAEAIKGIENEATAYLIHVKWLKDGQDITELSSEHKDYIVKKRGDFGMVVREFTPSISDEQAKKEQKGSENV